MLIDEEEKRISLRGSPPLNTPYSKAWEPIFPGFPYHTDRGQLKNEYKFLEGKLQGQTLIDLGSGRYRFIPNIANEFKAKTYIGVDRYYFADPPPHEPFSPGLFKTDLFKNVDGVYFSSQGTRIIRVQADLLDFFSRLKSNSVNFSINGIDEYIIRTPDYDKALQKEVIRATRNNGIFFGVNSDVFYGLRSSHDSNIKLVPMEQLYKGDRERLVFEKGGVGLPPVREKGLTAWVKDIFSRT